MRLSLKSRLLEHLWFSHLCIGKDGEGEAGYGCGLYVHSEWSRIPWLLAEKSFLSFPLLRLDGDVIFSDANPWSLTYSPPRPVTASAPTGPFPVVQSLGRVQTEASEPSTTYHPPFSIKYLEHLNQ